MWVPGARLVVMKLAVPLATGAVPMRTVPSRNLTEPAAVVGEIVAVRVIGVAAAALPGDAVRVEVVGFRMICVATDTEVAAESSVSPL